LATQSGKRKALLANHYHYHEPSVKTPLAQLEAEAPYDLEEA
jgi:hypothetical protein